MNIFEKYESEVRSYCRSFPVVFSKAKGSFIYDTNENKYYDFFNGAGALNYGHNNEVIMSKVIEYIKQNGITHALDMSTEAKKKFMETFINVILQPRGLDYKFMFCGSTGTNANEAAIKIARRTTGRKTIFAFMGSFHGMTLGSLALTSNSYSREGAGVSLNDAVFMPFPYGFNESFDTIDYIENVIKDDHSGIELPAAIIVETVQAEGGVIVAQIEWLKRLRELCTKYNILLICDDIQVGCGRTGTFFSFERAGIMPDIVTLSKSIGGCGFPMSLLLLKAEVDSLRPGEHNGTFRGNQLAFVAATEALQYYIDDKFLNDVKNKEQIITKWANHEIVAMNEMLIHRGIGLIHGIDFAKIPNAEEICKKIANVCFEHKLIIERAGRNDTVLKLMPPLTISTDELYEGLDIIKKSISQVLGKI